MRIAFLGTPAIAVPSLAALDDADDVEIVAVVTNPDRPRGRSGTPVPPPVKEAAIERGLRVLQPERPVEIVDALDAADLDAAAVVAYGALLPASVLDTGGRGFVNLHFSLLPRWRGAAPVQHAIRAGDEVTGVTTFVLDEGMDTGPVLAHVEVDIDPRETAGELLDRLAGLGADVLVDSLRALVAGGEPTPQPDEGATLAPRISTEDVRIDWSEPAAAVANLVRSANPRPGAHTTFRGERLKVWRARPFEPLEQPTDRPIHRPAGPPADHARAMRQFAGDGEAAPGTVIGAVDDGPVVATRDGAVVLTDLQPAGKAAMTGGDFVNGYQPEGAQLGSDDDGDG